MKKIVLLGDSIRMGYDKYVKESLSGVAEVYYPSENCRFAEYMLRYFHVWKENDKWPDDVDLIHWNAGLWDVLELFDDGPLTSIEYYAEAIARIYKRMRLFYPSAKIVFATSTPVLEDKYGEGAKRHNAIIEKYNEAAVKALSSTDALINDLYSLAKDFPEEYHSDCTHFATDKGTEIIGGRVISIICRELGIKASEVNIEGFEPENYSQSNIGI